MTYPGWDWEHNDDTDTDDCPTCGGTGEEDCALCDRDDPDRYTDGYGGYTGTCLDCGEPPGVIGAVTCEDCQGFGTLQAAVDAGYATYQ